MQRESFEPHSAMRASGAQKQNKRTLFHHIPKDLCFPKRSTSGGPLGLLAPCVKGRRSFYEMVLDSFDSFIRILPPEKKNFV
jgi:hypothetical protein